MHDVDYYAEHYPMPAFCFTPDAEFPVCNGEKGGFNGELVSPKFENGIITAFEGGVAHNAVPDRASCTVQVLPIFPCSHPQSIVGANELNFCVRDGNRCTLTAINTNYLSVFRSP